MSCLSDLNKEELYKLKDQKICVIDKNYKNPYISRIIELEALRPDEIVVDYCSFPCYVEKSRCYTKDSWLGLLYM